MTAQPTKSATPVDIEIGKRIREIRTAAGLSQETVARAAGISFQQIQKYEKGSNRVGGSRLMQIAAVLNVEPADLLPAGAARDQHPDDIAVDRFAAAMKAKLAQKRAEGRGGWEDPGEVSGAKLSSMLHKHVGKGDPVDVANFCMMLQLRGEKITSVSDLLAGAK